MRKVFEVELDGHVREIVSFWDKAVLRAEPAQLGVGHHPFYQVAAICAGGHPRQVQGGMNLA